LPIWTQRRATPSADQQKGGALAFCAERGMMPAPPLPDPILIQQGFRRVSVCGCELRYYRTGAGTPIVLLHPLRAQLEYFVPLLRHLDGGQADVLAVDLPGHGQSSAPRADYTAAYFTDAVEGFLDAAGIREAVLAGESIGGAIALALAARHNPRIARVVALNPYDYGRRGGIRRSSALANVLFTAMLWPTAGPLVARAGTRGVLRRVLAGGLHDPRNLPAALVEELYRCGSLPGHARPSARCACTGKAGSAPASSIPRLRCR
jgi:pimeloyl-ACP methyl ester carboxylesterase